MKNGRRIVALVTVLTLVLGTLGCAGADEITSGGFRLPGVKPRPTAIPGACDCRSAFSDASDHGSGRV